MNAIRKPAVAAAPRDLDFLGRMPVPLRRPFKLGLDRAVAAHRARTGVHLRSLFLAGAEWHCPFDRLAEATEDAELPHMLVTIWHHDILAPHLLARYAPADAASAPPCAPVAASLRDPRGVFRTFAAIPFVFLVDERRLQGRPAPRTWDALLAPHWADDIVFGGWRPNEQAAYQDYNAYLLASLYREYGADGLAAFAANVRHLQHNVRTAAQAGSNSASVGAVAILPWLQAELCPRRERIRVVWPEDGALAMPIGYLVKTGMDARVQPLVDYVTGAALGATLARNCYPPTGAALADAFPAGARLKWPGWEAIRRRDCAADRRAAAEIFFAVWQRRQEARACA